MPVSAGLPGTTSYIRRFFSWLALLGVLGAGGFGSAFGAVTDYPFRLVTREAGAGYEVTAENNGPAPITVFATVTGENFASDRQWPVTAVVPPYSVLPLGRMFAGPAAGTYNFLCNYNFHFGRADAAHDSGMAYRLPFENGRGFPVSQAYGGRLTSHANRANMHAVDFAMPIGTPVIAARAGTVIDVTLRHREGGDNIRYSDKANMVVIAHSDGTLAEYAHLSPGPEIVVPGQRVAAGALLGYSGSTGYTAGPHLHFVVSRASVNRGEVGRESLPVQFYSQDPALRFSARSGTTVWANYGKPVADTQTADADSAGMAKDRSPKAPQRGL